MTRGLQKACGYLSWVSPVCVFADNAPECPILAQVDYRCPGREGLFSFSRPASVARRRHDGIINTDFSTGSGHVPGCPARLPLRI